MSNVPSIFQSADKNSGSSYTPSAAASGYTPSTGGYVPSAAAGGTGSTYTPSGGGYTPSSAGMGMSYTPSAAAGGGSGYVPSAAAGGGGGYTPSAAASGSGYTPSAAAGGGGYTPSAAASGSGYTPSAAAGGGGYTPSAAASGGGYTPSAAAGGGGYTPSAAASGGGYTPSAAAGGGGYTPSAAARTGYAPSTTSTSSYVPSVAAQGSVTSAPSASAYVPSATAQGSVSSYSAGAPAPQATRGASPVYEKPNESHLQTAQATPYVSNANPLRSSYQHGSGPTNGVMTQQHNPVKCHKIDYEIKGSEMQLVEIHLDNEETVVAEAGAMMYLEDDIDFKTKFGDGSEPKQGFFKKLMAGAGRIMTGESLFITHFTNRGQMTRVAGFAAPYPGTILPIDMMELQQLYPSPNPDKPTSLICQKDAFLCAAKGTKLEMHFHKKIGSGLFGGEGFILQKLKGDGMAFCHAGGCVIKKELKQGEKLRVDTGCLVAYTSPGIDNDIQMAPGLKTVFFGGEGLFLATLTANSPQGGTVWIQSLPFSRLADRVVAHAPSIGGQRKGEGSAITGGFGGLLDGDGVGGGMGFGF